MSYKEINDELYENKLDLQFSPSKLNDLSLFERKKVELKLVNLIKSGVSTSYKYIPYITTINLLKIFPLDRVYILPFADELEINKYLYLLTHEKEYLNDIIEYAAHNLEIFTVLLQIYNKVEKDYKQELLNIILSLIKYTQDVNFLRMFNLCCMSAYDDNDIKKLFSEINPKEYLLINFSKTVSYQTLNDLESELLKMQKLTANDFITSDYNKRVISGMLGFALGDAMGVPLEFTDRKSTNFVCDMIGFGSHNVPEGTWSDDTSLMLATIDSIVKNDSISYNDIMNRFTSWLINAEYSADGTVFDIGKTTSNALRKYSSLKIEPTECGDSDLLSNGNGSLMRILPIVFYVNSLNLNDYEKTKIINDSSSLTHSHEISKMGCKIYSDFIEGLFSNDFDKVKAYDYIRNKDYLKYYSENTVKVYERILKKNISEFDVNDIQSSGYIVHSLEAALWSLLTTDSFYYSVIKAVNLGGDTDTVGAITGSLSGIVYCFNTFPEKWFENLKKKDYIIDLSIKFLKILQINKNKSFVYKNK